jgi:hypothetical protein
MFLITLEWTSVLWVLPLSIVLLIGSTASTPYGFPRIGPSRLWTLVTWKKPARFDLPRYAQIGYDKVCLISDHLIPR